MRRSPHLPSPLKGGVQAVIGDEGASRDTADDAANEPIWTPAGTPVRIGDVQVEVKSVTLGKVPLVRIITNDESESVDDLLTVRIGVTNLSERKKVDHRSWMSNFPSLLDGPPATLSDADDNTYRPSTFGATARVRGTEASPSIYPGKAVEDAVVFEPPVDGVQTLRLTLSAKMFGEEGEARFEIPAAMIRREGEPEPPSDATAAEDDTDTAPALSDGEQPSGVVARLTLVGDLASLPAFLDAVAESYPSAKSRVVPDGDGELQQVDIWGSRTRMSEARLQAIARQHGLTVRNVERSTAK